jgi:hypothetical protein
MCTIIWSKLTVKRLKQSFGPNLQHQTASPQSALKHLNSDACHFIVPLHLQKLKKCFTPKCQTL